MMLDLIITQNARDDLENITQYTFQNFGALQVHQYSVFNLFSY